VSAPVEGALRRAAASLLGAATSVRAAAYDSGALPAHRVEGLVAISVGNVRAGGSGKTPMAMHLAALLRDRGLPTAIISRGYRGRLERRGGLVSRGEGPLVGPEEAGDEAYLAAVRLSGVRVRVGADRVASARAEVAAGTRVAVLDDGFQHRRLHRDLDIVLLCPEDLGESCGLVPAGPLRERPGAAGRADLSCGIASDWEGAGSPPQVLVDLEPARLVDRRWSEVPLSDHRGARVHLLSGIARPERLAASAARAGLLVAGASAYPDHHRFARRDLLGAEAAARAGGAGILLTSEKDLPRLAGLEVTMPVLALRVEVRVTHGADVLDRHLASVLGRL